MLSIGIEVGVVISVDIRRVDLNLVTNSHERPTQPVHRLNRPTATSGGKVGWDDVEDTHVVSLA